MITQFLPSLEKFLSTEQEYITHFQSKGEKDVLARVISNMKGIAELQASQGVDAWLGYGVYLPAIEHVFAKHQGESTAQFYQRTHYPKDVVEAYTLKEHEIATLIAADKYSHIHQQIRPVNTSIWELNTQGLSIDLNGYPNRLSAHLQSESLLID